MARRTVFAISVLVGMVSMASVASAAVNECGARGLEIVQKAYPTAKPLPDSVFEVDGKTLTLPGEGSIGSDPHAMLCRIWPARPELLLVAVPLVSDDDYGGHDGHLDLLVLDERNLDVKSRHRLVDMMQDDALFIEALAFDTAFYQLAPGKVAFGLRRSLRSSSRPNPFSQTGLWLFVPDDDRLTPVLENLVVAKTAGEWDTRCDGEFEDLTRTLTMAPSPRSAAADIVASDRIVTSINRQAADDCNSTEKTATAKHRLRFKDGAYVVPEELRGF